MKKICIITATRAEFGLLKWIMREVDEAEQFCLQIVVTGAHLLKEQGHTIDIIREEGFDIDEIVDAELDSSTTGSIAASMGRMALEFSRTFEKLSPDYVIVLGDRYELLPIVSTAFVMRIPIVHIGGGDVTEGAIDDGIRNAVTMLSEYHFPGTIESANNIIRMRGSDKNVWAVGEPGLDSFFRETPISREELAEALGLDCNNKWVLFTYHSETLESLEYNLEAVKRCITILLKHNVQIVATYSNSDFGGLQINKYLEETARHNSDNIKVVPSFGNRRYLSIMKQVSLVIGNSSSGILEAPTLGIPVVNIGNRQKGRYQCKNVIQADTSESGLEYAISNALNSDRCKKDNYWGDGHTAERIIEIMEREFI